MSHLNIPIEPVQSTMSCFRDFCNSLCYLALLASVTLPAVVSRAWLSCQVFSISSNHRSKLIQTWSSRCSKHVHLSLKLDWFSQKTVRKICFSFQVVEPSQDNLHDPVGTLLVSRQSLVPAIESSGVAASANQFSRESLGEYQCNELAISRGLLFARFYSTSYPKHC